MLNTKSMLERTLDIYLENEEKKHPLRFPPCEKYKFAEPNSKDNIVFEDNERNSGITQIKGTVVFTLNSDRRKKKFAKLKFQLKFRRKNIHEIENSRFKKFVKSKTYLCFPQNFHHF